jgi:DNA-binding transcriptional regulator/RsmH inhibitor MraZ
MLTSAHLYTMDGKGRVIFPASFLRETGPSLVIVRAPGRCLLLLPVDRWERIAAAEGLTRFRPFFSARPVYVSPAAANRISIPVEFRQWAGFGPGRDLVIAGIGEGALICTEARWNEHLEQMERRLLATLARPASIRRCDLPRRPLRARRGPAPVLELTTPPTSTAGNDAARGIQAGPSRRRKPRAGLASTT